MKPSASDSTSPFLTSAQLAARWKVSHDTIQKMRRTKTGPAWLQLVPRKYVYPLPVVEKWEAEHLTTAIPSPPKPKRTRRKKNGS